MRRVVLARMCASTHSVQMDQRLLNLYTQVRRRPYTTQLAACMF